MLNQPQVGRVRIPWDIILYILEFLDFATLKAISLANRDLNNVASKMLFRSCTFTINLYLKGKWNRKLERESSRVATDFLTFVSREDRTSLIRHLSMSITLHPGGCPPDYLQAISNRGSSLSLDDDVASDEESEESDLLLVQLCTGHGSHLAPVIFKFNGTTISTLSKSLQHIASLSFLSLTIDHVFENPQWMKGVDRVTVRLLNKSLTLSKLTRLETNLTSCPKSFWERHAPTLQRVDFPTSGPRWRHTPMPEVSLPHLSTVSIVHPSQAYIVIDNPITELNVEAACWQNCIRQLVPCLSRSSAKIERLGIRLTDPTTVFILRAMVDANVSSIRRVLVADLGTKKRKLDWEAEDGSAAIVSGSEHVFESLGMLEGLEEVCLVEEGSQVVERDKAGRDALRACVEAFMDKEKNGSLKCIRLCRWPEEGSASSWWTPGADIERWERDGSGDWANYVEGVLMDE